MEETFTRREERWVKGVGGGVNGVGVKLGFGYKVIPMA